MGLEGLEEGLRVGEDMQLRERLNVQETVTNNTWREDVLVEERRNDVHSFTSMQCQQSMSGCSRVLTVSRKRIYTF